MTTARPPEPVAVLGLGRMGTAIARTFLEHGHSTTVWNRSVSRADPLATEGARVAGTPEEAVGTADLVVVCVTHTRAAVDVLDRSVAALPGRALLNLTSTTPEDARDVAARVVRTGATYLAGSAMAVPPAIGTGEADVLYSGDARVLAAHRATLEELGAASWVGSDPGAAALLDLVLLDIMWAALGGVYHAAALVGSDGMSATDFAPRAAAWLRTVAGFLTADAEEIDARDYTRAVSTLGVNAAGLDLLLRTSERRAVPPGVAAVVKRLVDARVRAGHGAESLADLAEHFRPDPSSVAE